MHKLLAKLKLLESTRDFYLHKYESLIDTNNADIYYHHFRYFEFAVIACELEIAKLQNQQQQNQENK